MVETEFQLIVGWGLMWDFLFSFGPKFIDLACKVYDVVGNEWEPWYILTGFVCKL